MNLPNCPLCNTNEFMEQVSDCSCHAEGALNGSVYHSDLFICSKCGGYISYMEETIGKEIMWVAIDYRKDGYVPNVKIVG